MGILCLFLGWMTSGAQTPTTLVINSVTTAETNAESPEMVDTADADIQVLKTADGSADREAYVKFDISNLDVENLTYAAISGFGGQHNGDASQIAPYLVKMYTCAETDWTRDDLTWNTATGFTIGADSIGMTNIQGFGTYHFYSPAIVDYLIAQKNDGQNFVAFKFVANDVHPFDSWLSGSWEGMELTLSYSEPYMVVPSVTTAETDAANPDDVDADVDNANDVQVLKTADGSGDREAYVKFDISEVETGFLKHAVISCYAGQHNGDAEVVDPYWVEIYGCADTAWSRADLTWNIAKDFTIGTNPLAVINVQGFAAYDFSTPEIAQYIRDKKTEGADYVAFKFVARNVHDFDSWLSGAWEGMDLSLYQGNVDAEAIQDLETGDVYAGSPQQTDTIPNDIMVWKTSDGSGDIKGYVSFDISSLETTTNIYASIAFMAGQHAPTGEDPLEKFIVDLCPVLTTGWTRDVLDWDTTMYFNETFAPVASVNIWGFDDYYFSSPELAGFINSQVNSGADKIAFKMVARDVTGWDAWLTGDWNGMHLSLADPSAAYNDTEPPTDPGNLEASAGITSVALSWDASTDDYQVDGYKIFKGDELIATIGEDKTSYTAEDLQEETEYTFSVLAFDKRGNESNKVSVTVETLKPAFNITIDAVLDEDWNNFELWKVEKLLDGWEAPESEADCSGEFRLAWSPDGLYMFIEVFDDVRNVDESYAGYNRDHVEVNIDPYNNKTVSAYTGGQMQFSFTPDPALSPGVWLNGADNTTGIDVTKLVYSFLEKNSSYIFEVFYPWSALGRSTTPEPEDMFGFDVTIADADDDVRETVLGFYVSSGEYNTWDDPSIWSSLIFKAGGSFEMLVDTIPPTMVETVLTDLQCNDIKVTWTPSTDNMEVAQYDILDEYGEVVHSVDGADTSYIFYDLEPGTYYYTVIAKDGAGNASEINLEQVKEVTVTETDCPVGINPVSVEKSLNIYPNPATDKVNISGCANVKEVQVFDVLGQKVMNINVTNDKVELNTSGLKNGIYLIRFTDNADNNYFRKVIKK